MKKETFTTIIHRRTEKKKDNMKMSEYYKADINSMKAWYAPIPLFLQAKIHAKPRDSVHKTQHLNNNSIVCD